MMTHTVPRLASPLAAIAVIALAGCASTPPATSVTPAPQTSAPTNPTTPATPAPVDPPSSQPVSTPTEAPTQPAANAPSCDELLPTDVLARAFGGTFKLNHSYSPATSTPEHRIAENGGVACEWVQAGGPTFALAAGIPGESIVHAGKSEASRAGETSDVFGPNRTTYLSGPGGSIVDVFGDAGAWIHMTSSLLSEPGRAASIVTDVMQALPS